MERARIPEPEAPPVRWRHTALRTLAAIVLCGAFLWGSSSLSLGLTTVLALAIAAAVLVGYELSVRDVAMEWITAVVLGILWSGGLGYAAWYYTRPPQPTGPLLPANEPTPATHCREPVGPNDLVMVAAENRVVGKGDGTLHMLTVQDCPMLTLRRVGGGVVVDATFYDWTDDIAFRVANNVYEPYMPLQLRQFRPDPHTLVILDRFDQEVLYLRFLNPHALRLRGRFLCAERPQVIIRDHAVLVGGVRVGGVFMGQHPDRARRCAVAKDGGPGLVFRGG